MAREQPTAAYTEVQIDEDSISLTLISESGSNGAIIEDTERFTFDELETMSGEHRTLRLSRESVNALEESDSQQFVEGVPGIDGAELVENLKSEQVSGLPEVGAVYTDENAPGWSNEDCVEVVEVLEDVRCDEYIIESFNSDRKGRCVEEVAFHEDTVADANPSYDASEAVVIGQYNGSGDEYAFPASRLV
jgi:hypothetical protein